MFDIKPPFGIILVLDNRYGFPLLIDTKFVPVAFNVIMLCKKDIAITKYCAKSCNSIFSSTFGLKNITR